VTVAVSPVEITELEPDKFGIVSVLSPAAFSAERVTEPEVDFIFNGILYYHPC
jgi:hypothetical protein